MSKRSVVTLTQDERAALGQRVSSGRGLARGLTHARVLLKADSGPAGPAWPDEAISVALDVGRSTVEQVRRRFVDRSGGVAASNFVPCEFRWTARPPLRE